MPNRKQDEWLLQIGLNVRSIELPTDGYQSARGSRWHPNADIFEEDGRFVVRVEVAGTIGDSVVVHYLPDRHVLALKGRREDEFAAHVTAWHQMEIQGGEFYRELALPDKPIVADQIKAHLRNGILIVLVPFA